MSEDGDGTCCWLILAIVLIAGPLCLIDAIIYTTTGDSIWHSMYGYEAFPEYGPTGMYNIWFMWIFGVIVSIFDAIVILTLVVNLKSKLQASTPRGRIKLIISGILFMIAVIILLFLGFFPVGVGMF